MTGTEIRKIREAYGLTNELFAQLLGVDMRTVYRWQSVNGEVPIDMLRGNILPLLDAKKNHRETVHAVVSEVLATRNKKLVPVQRTGRHHSVFSITDNGLRGLYALLHSVYGAKTTRNAQSRTRK